MKWYASSAAGGLSSLFAEDAAGYGWGTEGTVLVRVAANHYEIRNGANPTTLSLSLAYTSASDFERGGLQWADGKLRLRTVRSGSGKTIRPIYFAVDDTDRWLVGTSGHFQPATTNL